jgi:hypothetical protein
LSPSPFPNPSACPPWKEDQLSPWDAAEKCNKWSGRDKWFVVNCAWATKITQDITSAARICLYNKWGPW